MGIQSREVDVMVIEEAELYNVVAEAPGITTDVILFPLSFWVVGVVM